MSQVIPVALQQRMCHSKRVHLTEMHARAAIARRRRRARVDLRAYQCPNCTFWHLTKKPLKGASRPRGTTARRPAMTRNA